MADTLSLPMSSNSAPPAPECELLQRLADTPLREVVELVSIDLPPEEMEPLLERGVLPGCQLCPVRLSPAGDPIVMVDGTLIALRREMAGCLCVRPASPRDH